MSEQLPYRTLNVTSETFDMVGAWRRRLEQEYLRRVTVNEVIEYLLDATGPPDETAQVAQEKDTNTTT